METKLVYKDRFEKNAYSLIELGTPELLAAFESGNSIVIKGLAEDEAVLCTDTKTFMVRQVNTSNSIILTERDDLEAQHKVQDNLSHTIELLPCLARTSRLDELLGHSCYSGEENEEAIKASQTMYRLEDLLTVVQASKSELLKGLDKRGAFVHEDYYRLFEKDYLLQLFDYLLTNSIINGIDIKMITLGEAKQCIKEGSSEEKVDIPDDLLVSAINVFLTRVDHQDKEHELIEFDRAKICRFMGEWMLSNPRSKRWELGDFTRLWSTMCHELFTPELQDIDGLYLMYETIKLSNTVQYLQYFPVSELSTDPPQRFAALFSEKPLWTLAEIQPFLVDLAPTKKEQEHLLLKFARSHRSKNITSYGSRIK
ncbi:hypothetical protein INT47_013250 [Mucor saturninus]|uniref:Sister chromatid cohesion protein DCC1 n=1 Tax=Mucor saturninus TaxID=64648 RepID=A0A8H7V6F2_9FUNG|nr:hypothetical protein INT47_013250 [Mucor saturninus]